MADKEQHVIDCQHCPWLVLINVVSSHWAFPKCSPTNLSHQKHCKSLKLVTTVCPLKYTDVRNCFTRFSTTYPPVLVQTHMTPLLLPLTSDLRHARPPCYIENNSKKKWQLLLESWRIKFISPCSTPDKISRWHNFSIRWHNFSRNDLIIY